MYNVYNGLLTLPRLNGRLFWVQRISVSGIDPSTSQLMLYSISDAKCFGFDVMLIEVGRTVDKKNSTRNSVKINEEKNMFLANEGKSIGREKG